MRASTLELRAGDLELGLVPELGGSVAYFRKRTAGGNVDLFRPLSERDHAASDILGVAMFPMVPYANCIEGNVFEFEGQRHRVEPNLPGYKFNFHGRGWRSEWKATAVESRGATLELRDDEPEQPHRYLAAQQFVLEDDQLILRTTISNLGPRRMPFGFGQHPWFPRRDETYIKFGARQFWIESIDSSATEPITIPPELDFSGARPPPMVRRNNCYGGWSGNAEITWPGEGVGLRMTADPIFRQLMVYFPAPPTDAFCLEPQTNLISALTRIGVAAAPQDLGLIVLEPGQSTSGEIIFAPFDV
jgi:aldose 1-epimerase